MKRSRAVLVLASSLPAVGTAFFFFRASSLLPARALELRLSKHGASSVLRQSATELENPRSQLPCGPDLLAAATSFTRIDRVDIRDWGSRQLLKETRYTIFRRHLQENTDTELVASAVSLLLHAGVSGEDVDAALVVGLRIAEATQDASMTAAAIVEGFLKGPCSTRPAVSASEVSEALGLEVAFLAENCAEMMALWQDSRGMLWADATMMRLGGEQTDNQQNLLIIGATDWRVVTFVLVQHTQHLEDKAALAASHPSCRRLGRDAYVMAREALDVYAPLASRLGMHALKNELEDLGFRHLFPEEHAAISREIASRFASSKEVLDETLLVLKRALQEDTLFMGAIHKVSFEARAKQPYSVWRKLTQRAKSNQEGGGSTGATEFDVVLDQLALRVVFEVNDDGDLDHGEEEFEVDTDGTVSARAKEEEALRKNDNGKALCYHVLGLVHEQWCHDEFRVKDYVKTPKPNGYQSLHTTALCRHHGKLWPFEVQVRTVDMHRVAEWGGAAHSRYKSESGGSSSFSTDFPWECLAGTDDMVIEEAHKPTFVPLSKSHAEPSPVEGGAKRSMAQLLSVGLGASPLTMLSRSPKASEVNYSAPDRIRDEREYAHWLHDELSTRRVYVFMTTRSRNGGDIGYNGVAGISGPSSLPSATLWDLETGTSIKDAIWRHRNVHGVGAVEKALAHLRINGDKVPADYKLRNGDAIVLH